MGNFIFCAVCVALFTTIWKIHFFFAPFSLHFFGGGKEKQYYMIWKS